MQAMKLLKHELLKAKPSPMMISGSALQTIRPKWRALSRVLGSIVQVCVQVPCTQKQNLQQ